METNKVDTLEAKIECLKNEIIKLKDVLATIDYFAEDNIDEDSWARTKEQVSQETNIDVDQLIRKIQNSSV